MSQERKMDEQEKTEGTENEGLGEIAPLFQQVSCNHSLDEFSYAKPLFSQFPPVQIHFGF